MTASGAGQRKRPRARASAGGARFGAAACGQADPSPEHAQDRLDPHARNRRRLVGAKDNSRRMVHDHRAHRKERVEKGEQTILWWPRRRRAFCRRDERAKERASSVDKGRREGGGLHSR